MKARVKATGDIINLEYKRYSLGHRVVWKYEDEEGVIWDEDEFEIVEDGPDYWERLKHQYAGMAMQGLLSCKDIIIEMGNLKGKSVEDGIALASDKFATALVERMKNNNNNQ